MASVLEESNVAQADPASSVTTTVADPGSITTAIGIGAGILEFQSNSTINDGLNAEVDGTVATEDQVELDTGADEKHLLTYHRLLGSFNPGTTVPFLYQGGEGGRGRINIGMIWSGVTQSVPTTVKATGTSTAPSVTLASGTYTWTLSSSVSWTVVGYQLTDIDGLFLHYLGADALVTANPGTLQQKDTGSTGWGQDETLRAETVAAAAAASLAYRNPTARIAPFIGR